MGKIKASTALFEQLGKNLEVEGEDLVKKIKVTIYSELFY